MTRTLLTFALLSTVLLCACANTRQGISKDTERFGQKLQKASAVMQEP